MADGRNPWLTWALPLVVVGVLVLSNVAWRQKPQTTLVASTSWSISAQLSTPAHLAAWRLVVDLPDDLKPPGPEWMLHEGPQPGQGYELHWLPARLSLQVWRAGEQLQLLGSVTLDRAPHQVVVIRHGLRLTVEVDRTPRISCLDLQPTAAPDTWGLVASADMGGASARLYDERRFLTPGEKDVMSDQLADLQRLADDPGLTTGSVHAIARVRIALALGARQGAQADEARRDAGVALRALAENDPDRASLLAWLGWESARSALLRGDTQALASRAEALVAANELKSASELPGLLIDLIDRLSIRASTQPTRPVPPAEVFATRRAWLSAISTLGVAVVDADSVRFAPSENLAWNLRLAVHAVDCLIGRARQPTPAEGPAWVADRWRAFAGVPVKVRAFSGEPSGFRDRDPLTRTVGRLVSLAGFDPLLAVGLCANVEEDVIRGDQANAHVRLAEAPVEIARQVALTKAILAIRSLTIRGPEMVDAVEVARVVKEAREILAQPAGGEHPLVAEDPLAFAMDRLLDLLGQRRRENISGVLPGVPKLPELLTDWAPILTGLPTAPREVWRVLPERPLEGLAAALIMQEIAGETPDWSLLAQAPAFTVPLRLLMPITRPTLAPPIPTTDPVPPVPVVP